MQDAPDSRTALVLAGLDWKVVQRPVCVDGGEVPGYLANVRATDGRVLGIVSSRYSVVQNHEAFEWTDSLIDTGRVRYETAGSLRGGRVVWLLARLDEHREILGDEIAPYLLFVNAHDGSMAVRVCMTPVRVVCANTLNVALHRADMRMDRSWSAAHLGDLQGKLREAQRTLGLAYSYLDRLGVLAERLADIDVPESRWLKIVEQLLPLEEDAGDVRRRNVAVLREDLMARIQAPDLARFRGTGWAVLNAVADHVAHVRPLVRTPTWRESRFGRIVEGHPLLDKVLEILLPSPN